MASTLFRLHPTDWGSVRPLSHAGQDGSDVGGSDVSQKSTINKSSLKIPISFKSHQYMNQQYQSFL
jgi:hypothetical protein